MQRVIVAVVGLLVVFWIISSPTTAAGTVNTVLGDLASAGNSLILFLRNLV